MTDEDQARERRAIIRREAEATYALIRRTEDQAAAWAGTPEYQAALAEIVDKGKRAAVEAAIYAGEEPEEEEGGE